MPLAGPCAQIIPKSLKDRKPISLIAVHEMANTKGVSVKNGCRSIGEGQILGRSRIRGPLFNASWIESDRDEGQILSTSLNLWRSKIEARAWIGLQACSQKIRPN